MSRANADVTMSVIRGSADAERLVASIREGCAPADALMDAIEQVSGLDDDGRLRSFLRGVQKALERWPA
jgi:hypothetical protein